MLQRKNMVHANVCGMLSPHSTCRERFLCNTQQTMKNLKYDCTHRQSNGDEGEVKTMTGEHAEGDDRPKLLTLHSKEEAEYFNCLAHCCDCLYGEYWFSLSRLSMMVIGSFASYTKTKSVESAV